ncbi:MAG TPA: 4-hydroxybenzoate 3-monooxygenase [Allosphingosinicella sp.]|nr:4-hydroxybenzoate 3-monooxygenase [Allosphingosinicella sp.]
MAAARRTQVGIVGSGPAGLLLGHSLRQAGYDTILIERQSREHVERRIRAGLLERTTTDLVERLELADGLRSKGIPETGFNLTDGDRLIHIDVEALTGKQMTMYGQTELTYDLIKAAPGRGLEIVWEAADVALHDIDSVAPWITFTKDGAEQRVDCLFIAGCDGFHGVSRRSIPKAAVSEYERTYPFGWLGILSDVPPCDHQNIYANHERGFALASLRSMTRSRYYIQVPLDERLEDWSDDRLWDELAIRLGPQVAAKITRGPALEKSIAPLRSYVFEPMAYGRLFLAGDSAHIVPPTGAKGLNLAASDVTYLSEALINFLRDGEEKGLKGYSQKALARVWKAERFSWYLTNLMHRFPDTGPFERAMQVSEMEYIASSVAMQTVLAENYVGIPL